MANGGVKCWGLLVTGAQGSSLKLTPVQIPGLGGVSPQEDAVAADAGMQHTCALLVSGAVKCWGNDFYGQLGQGFCCVDRGEPVQVIGLGPKPTPTTTGTATTTPPLFTATPISSRTEPAATALPPTVGALPETGHGGGSGPTMSGLWPVALAGAGAALAGCAARLQRRKGARMR